uniref:Mucolipin TRP cation channel 3a n=1 Tax=Neolamprologus brichardi TaxID=32507 RepID=A0A3Q4GSI8_NEOBR
MEDSKQLLAARSEESQRNGCCGLDTKMVEDFRRRLKYFFMNPCEKYRARGRKPWKLTIQILKITVRHHELPDCYDFHIVIVFDNRAHSGKIKVDIENDVRIYECSDWNVEAGKNDYLLLSFDSVVILACFASLILCLRSVVHGIQLQFEFSIFFSAYYNKTVSWSDRMEFVNGWYILIIVSDIMTITGSVVAELSNLSVVFFFLFILLGTATMLVWVGVIRYLSFFKKYNILILTLRAALPNVFRFCVCAAIIYLGYCFCGWIVLGPYHDKFRTLAKVTECLFSLLNGDDMFSTFLRMRDKTYMVWLFSRLYLYSFISIFIYMVLSLFIALITDTYETIKKDKEPVSQLQAFIAECIDQPESGRYQITDENICCWSRKSETEFFFLH